MPAIDVIQKDFTGGLDTLHNPLQVAPNASPYLLNVMCDKSGSLIKREGTQVMYENSTEDGTWRGTKINTQLERKYVVAKNSNKLEVYELAASPNPTTGAEGELNKVMTKANVFADAAKSSNALVITTAEFEPRVIFVMAESPPVSVRFTEEAQQITNASPATTADFTDLVSNVGNTDAEDIRWRGLSTSNTLVYVDGEIESAPTFSWATGNLVIGNLTSFSGTKTVEVVKITWNWYAESAGWSGDELYGTSIRTNNASTGLGTVVQIPENLSYDMTDPDAIQYPYVVWDASASAFTYTATPTTSSEYAYSDGTVDGTVNKFPTPFFVTFGAVTGSTPTAVGFSRIRKLDLQGDEGIEFQYLDALSVGGTATYDYYGEDWASGPIASPTPTDKIFYVSTDGTSLTSTSYHVFSNNDTQWMGSAATSSSDNTGTRTDGNYLSAPGNFYFSDYVRGVFVQQSSLVGNRFVASGVRSDPMGAYVSGVPLNQVGLDDGVVSFMLTDNPNLNLIKPFRIVVGSQQGDVIEGVHQWQDGIFVFSQDFVHEIVFEGGVINPVDYQIRRISTDGCVGHSAITETTSGLAYISYDGVYLVRFEQQGLGNGYFTTENVSPNLRDLFEDTSRAKLQDLALLRYLPRRNWIIVGMPDETVADRAAYLLVLDLENGFWSKWSSLWGFQCSDIIDIERTDGVERMCLATIAGRDSSNNPSGFVLLGDGDLERVDYRRQVTAAGAEELITNCAPIPELTYTGVYGQTKFSTTDTTQPLSFELIDLQEINDCEVLVNGEAQQFGQDWVKDTDSDVYMLRQIWNSDVVTLRPRRFVADSDVGQSELGLTSPRYTSPVMVWRDNVFLQESDDFTINFTNSDTESTEFQITEAGGSVSGSYIWYGLAYPAYWESPAFNLDRLTSVKQITHVSLMFDNSDYLDRFDSNDINSGASQDPAEIDGLWKFPTNVNVAIRYNGANNGFNQADVYGYRDLLFGLGIFDYPAPGGQAPKHVNFREPVHGIGYDYSLLVYSYDNAAFSLAGYQISGRQRPGKYQSVVE